MHTEWKKRNPSKYASYANKYYQNNKEKVIQANYKYTKSRRVKDISYNIAILLRQRFTRAIKSGYKLGSAVKNLGCTVDEFKDYLQSKFEPGMSWDNHGRNGWHIDHIIPLSKFNLENREEVLRAVHYTNLQPLWAVDNLRKGNR